jgi:hypothetical protein
VSRAVLTTSGSGGAPGVIARMARGRRAGHSTLNRAFAWARWHAAIASAGRATSGSSAVAAPDPGGALRPRAPRRAARRATAATGTTATTACNQRERSGGSREQ